MTKRLETGYTEIAKTVLGRSRSPLNCREIVKRADAAGLLKSNGETPHKTLHALLSRNIAAKGQHSEFRKASRGLFTLARKD